MPSIKLAIFDLSGTTVEDDNAVAKSLFEAAKEFDLPVTLEEFERSIGTNKIHLYQYMIARSRGESISIDQLESRRFPELEAEAMKLFDRYTEIMIAHYEQHVTAMPGAEETFAWCKENGIRVATDTGFHQNVVDAIMNGLKWDKEGLIDLAVNVEHTGGIGRPAPFMIFHIMQQLGIHHVRQVLKVGDTPSDLISGWNAGCGANVGVLSGANPIDVLGKYHHTHILPDVSAIPELLQREY